MAFPTKLYLVALVFIILSKISGPSCTSVSSLHQREIQKSKWFSDCRSGYRKLDLMNCENAGGLTDMNMNRDAWSESLKKALSPPPSPTKTPPAPRTGADPPPT